MCRQRSQFSPSWASIITPSCTLHLRSRRVSRIAGHCTSAGILAGGVISAPAAAVLRHEVALVQTQRTDEELAAALAAREPSALEELYDRYGRMAFSLAVRIVGSPETAE